jgi:hypothetical protein
LKILGLWFIPVILIPLIWPLSAFSIGEFNYWLDGVYYQTHRDAAIGTAPSIFDSIKAFFEIDPVLITLGGIAIVFTAKRRDFLPLLWSVPLVIF